MLNIYISLYGGNPQTYTTRILRRERTLLPLTVVEALYIEKQYPETSMNDKNEAGRGGLVRFTARRSYVNNVYSGTETWVG